MSRISPMLKPEAKFYRPEDASELEIRRRLWLSRLAFNAIAEARMLNNAYDLQFGVAVD